MFPIKFKLTEQAIEISKEQGIDFTPVRGSKLAGGYDIKNCSSEPIEIPLGQTIQLHTGIHLDIADAVEELDSDDEWVFAALIVPRSGLGSKGFYLRNTIGVVDADYQGEVLLRASNRNESPITILPGERIAQLLFVPCGVVQFIEVEEFEEATERGEGGFGHTGRS
jgi:dUTP pyrophosphatase